MRQTEVTFCIGSWDLLVVRLAPHRYVLSIQFVRSVSCLRPRVSTGLASGMAAGETVSNQKVEESGGTVPRGYIGQGPTCCIIILSAFGLIIQAIQAQEEANEMRKRLSIVE